MVQRVRQEYLQDMEQLMKGYLETNRQDWIQENFKNPANWCDLGFFEFIDNDEMVLKVRPKRTGDNGTIAQNKKGDFLLNRVDIEGRLQYFVAFCFQEGELAPEFSFFDAKPAAQYRDNYIGIDYCSDFNLKEWRGYIMNKYGIYPPNLDGAFAAMLDADLVWITGGLAIGELVT